MKQVALREFQLQPKKYLKELPIELISREGIVGVIIVPDKVVNKSEAENVNNPLPDENLVNKHEKVATYTVSKKPLEGLKPLPENGTYLAIEGIPHNKPETLQEDVTSQYAQPTGKCQVPNGICRNRGYKYRASFYDSEGEVTREVFLCDLHVRKMREGNVEVVEV